LLDLPPGRSCADRLALLLLARWRALPRTDAVIDRADARRLASELILAALEPTPTGVEAFFLAVNDLADVDRALVLATVDGLGARCLRELAHAWDMEPAEALRRITSGT
jgi:hypothetical protein